MAHPSEPTPDDNSAAVSEADTPDSVKVYELGVRQGERDIVEAFNVGQAIERHRTSEAIAALERIQKRFDDAEIERRNSYARGYVDGLDGREPEFTTLYERLRGTRKTHAFTVERTNGDHFVWRCRCGDVLIQDPDNTTIHDELIAHAKGGKR